MAKKKAARKQPGKKPTKVIDEPTKIVQYKQGDLIDGMEVLEEAAMRTKQKDPMAFDITWETADENITLHIAGEVTLERKKKR